MPMILRDPRAINVALNKVNMTVPLRVLGKTFLLVWVR